MRLILPPRIYYFANIIVLLGHNVCPPLLLHNVSMLPRLLGKIIEFLRLDHWQPSKFWFSTSWSQNRGNQPCVAGQDCQLLSVQPQVRHSTPWSTNFTLVSDITCIDSHPDPEHNLPCMFSTFWLFVSETCAGKHKFSSSMNDYSLITQSQSILIARHSTGNPQHYGCYRCPCQRSSSCHHLLECHKPAPSALLQKSKLIIELYH